MIEVDQYQLIRQMYLVKGKSQREIARELNISRNTVAKYCNGDALPTPSFKKRPKIVLSDDVLAKIKEYLQEDQEAFKLGAKKQKHTAKRIYERLKEENELTFKGSYETIARTLRQMRQNQGLLNVYIPLAWDPGDAMQVDWGEATVIISGNKVKCHMFCARLCHSAFPFVVIFPAERSEFFLEGHKQAFEFYKGATRRVIYDNLKTAVQEGWERYVKKEQPTLKLLKAHYAFESEFCNRGQANEKGLVENLVGWVRRNILTPIPKAESWDELNLLLQNCCTAYLKHQVKGKNETVGTQYAKERTKLLPLPRKPFETCRMQICKVHKDSLIRIDNNHYSVPCSLVNQMVTVKAFAFHIEM